MKTLCLKFRYLHYLPRCRKYCPFFRFDLGMKIPTGVGGLDKSFNRTNPSCNPKRHVMIILVIPAIMHSSHTYD